MPAWCCDSMIAPFVRRGIRVDFYDAQPNGGLEYFTDIIKSTDIFYLSNYFGYEDTVNIEIIKKIKGEGSIIIYDRTHSFLMDDENYKELADYSFVSIRKWMGVIGGALVEGLTEVPELKACQYAHIKERAMLDKYRYLMGDKTIIKDEFLAAFAEFGHKLAADYHNYEMDNLSYTIFMQADLQAMKDRRRKNATYIHKNLKRVQFIYNLTNGAVPLFVPVLFETKEQRDAVRNKLIEKKIYCPVHWPKPAQITGDYRVNDVVNREMSLLCDQRYGLREMEREVNTIMDLL